MSVFPCCLAAESVRRRFPPESGRNKNTSYKHRKPPYGRSHTEVKLLYPAITQQFCYVSVFGEQGLLAVFDDGAAGDNTNEGILIVHHRYKILPHKKNDEVYLFGNPPYLGSSLQNEVQKDDMKFVFKHALKKYKNLDYISCWFFLGKNYIKNTKGKFAFVSTNSIFQGEQVGLLWPSILSDVYINFAYHEKVA